MPYVVLVGFLFLCHCVSTSSAGAYDFEDHCLRRQLRDDLATLMFLLRGTVVSPVWGDFVIVSVSKIETQLVGTVI